MDRAQEADWPPVALQEDTYGLTTCTLLRDLTLLSRGLGGRANRYLYLCQAVGLLAICITLQVVVLVEARRFVAAKEIHDIRKTYSEFEEGMYGSTRVLASGGAGIPAQVRGVGGVGGPHFDELSFARLPEEVRQRACSISLSQPWFLWAVLFIWTLTIVDELRHWRTYFNSLIINTRAADSMRDAFEEGVAPEREFEDHSVVVVVRLTYFVKTLLMLVVFLPRISITLYLLWVGCSWLLATTDFQSLVINSLALQFILHFKDLLYVVLVPRRSKLYLSNTRLMPSETREPDNLHVLVGTGLWALASLAWTVGYTGFNLGGGLVYGGLQRVVVDYQWDVHQVCSEWVARRYSV